MVLLMQHQVDDLLHVTRVEEVLLRVVVGGGGDDDELGVLVSRCAVEGGRQVEVLLGKVFLDVFVLDRRFAMVDKVDLLGDDVHGGDVVVLCQQRGDAQAYVACACYCNVHIRCSFVFEVMSSLRRIVRWHGIYDFKNC